MGDVFNSARLKMGADDGVTFQILFAGNVMEKYAVERSASTVQSAEMLREADFIANANSDVKSVNLKNPAGGFLCKIVLILSTESVLVIVLHWNIRRKEKGAVERASVTFYDAADQKIDIIPICKRLQLMAGSFNQIKVNLHGRSDIPGRITGQGALGEYEQPLRRVSE